MNDEKDRKKATSRDERLGPMRALLNMPGEYRIPGPLVPGFMARRGELIRGAATGREFSPSEVEGLVDAVASLVDERQLYDQHLQRMAVRLKALEQMLGGALGTAAECIDMAEFREPIAEEEGR